MAPLAGAMMLNSCCCAGVVSLERRCNTIRGANAGLETAAGVELSGAVYRLLTALELKQELWGLVIVAAGLRCWHVAWC